MPKQLTPDFILAKNRLEPQTPWVELYEVLAVGGSVPLRFANHPARIVWHGAEYEPIAMTHETLSEETHSGLKQFTIHVANALRMASGVMNANDGLRGAKVTMILANINLLGLGDLRSSYYVESATVSDETASFSLGKPVPVFDLYLPGQLIERDLFPAIPPV